MSNTKPTLRERPTYDQYINKLIAMHKKSEIVNRLQYWKRVKNMMETHKLKEKSVLFRKKLLDDSIKTNYKHEYDRLRSTLQHSVVDAQTKENIDKRIAYIDSLKLGIA